MTLMSNICDLGHINTDGRKKEMAEKKKKNAEQQVEKVEKQEPVPEGKTETEKEKAEQEMPKEAGVNAQDDTAKLQEELAQQKDLLLRTAAEFDNYKRRTEKEKLTAAEYTSANLLKKLLPVFDNVDRANAADRESAEYAKGVEMIVKMLTDAVKDLGLVTIGEVGDTFDPAIHEAVMHVEDENFGENTVCNVLKKGYKFGDTVIRPAMVQVAN